jgi:Cof subfamily protein (haloacid dehalogenase superfamily)
MIRLLVSDLDGTLLTDDKKISQADKIALEKLQKAGIDICFATGRNKEEIKNVMRDLEFHYHQVSQNGAQIYSANGTLLHSSSFQGYTGLELYQFIRSLGFDVPVIVDAYLNAGQSEFKRLIPTEHKSYFQYQDDHVFQHVSELDQKIGYNAFPIKFSYFEDVQKLRTIETEVHKRFPDMFTSFMVDKNCLDFMPLHVNKGTGLQILFDHLRVRPDEVVCIGDSENDIAMFDLITHSFAMNTASSVVRSKASQTVTSVADAVEWTISYSEKNAIKL